MSASENGSSSPRSQLPSRVFGDLLDSIIVDVASECHRIARLGLDRNLEEEEEELRLSAQARVASTSSSSEANGKNVLDIFGQTHPAIASEILDCMNCGRPVVAGRFAPHLERCMGKVMHTLTTQLMAESFQGRKARQKATRSTTMARSRDSCGSPVSVFAPCSDANNINRVANDSSSSSNSSVVEEFKVSFEEA